MSSVEKYKYISAVLISVERRDLAVTMTTTTTKMMVVVVLEMPLSGQFICLLMVPAAKKE